jgi:Coenzyme PQQ synthesis protein D (PqqD)
MTPPPAKRHEQGKTMPLAKYVKFREEKFGGVLFETRSEKVFTLNAAAAAVVREINAGGDEREISGRLKQRFDDRNAKIDFDVSAFIAELRQKGLIQD